MRVYYSRLNLLFPQLVTYSAHEPLLCGLACIENIAVSSIFVTDPYACFAAFKTGAITVFFTFIRRYQPCCHGIRGAKHETTEDTEECLGKTQTL